MKKNICDFLTVIDAAKYLGVSPSTLRNWDRTGKLKAKRHPLNDYRLYLQEDLDLLLSKIESHLKGHNNASSK